jgi:hypothetical protein
MDLGRHTVLDEGREVKLTAKEFMLLQYLLQHRGPLACVDRRESGKRKNPPASPSDDGSPRRRGP